jgi:hypothetical protein
MGQFFTRVRAVFTRIGPHIPADASTEVRELDQQAWDTTKYLVVVLLISLLLGAFFLSGVADGLGAYLLSWLPDGAHLAEAGRRSTKFLGQALIGVSGSAVAALISCLNRYANGFESYDGKLSYPEDAKDKEKFSARFATWLWARPYLGAPVAPAFIWGLSHFTNHPQEFTTSNRLIGFTAFMAGLLAKSVLDLVRGLFKNVFKS